jgi:hypothetical protein
MQIFMSMATYELKIVLFTSASTMSLSPAIGEFNILRLLGIRLTSID